MKSVFACDACGADAPLEIKVAALHSNGQPLHVCSKCGLVYVRERRSSDEIAKDWSDNLYGSHYTSVLPAIKARLTYVAETANDVLGLTGKSLCDLGAGEGTFLDYTRALGAEPYGVDPSGPNVVRMTRMGLPAVHVTIENFGRTNTRRFDAASLLWTLECCTNPRDILRVARETLKPDGRLIYATSSRILVPFKKLLGEYVVPVAADTHPLRPSARTMTKLLGACGFTVVYENRWRDSDVLLLIAKPGPVRNDLPGDDPKAVLSFFDRWHAESEHLKSSMLPVTAAA